MKKTKNDFYALARWLHIWGDYKDYKKLSLEQKVDTFWKERGYTDDEDYVTPESFRHQTDAELLDDLKNGLSFGMK